METDLSKRNHQLSQNRSLLHGKMAPDKAASILIGVKHHKLLKQFLTGEELHLQQPQQNLKKLQLQILYLPVSYLLTPCQIQAKL